MLKISDGFIQIHDGHYVGMHLLEPLKGDFCIMAVFFLNKGLVKTKL
jgi:hypothetical protein